MIKLRLISKFQHRCEMYYYAEPLPDGRWGIYVKKNLLATIGSQEDCKAIIEALNQRQPKTQRLRKHYLQLDDLTTTPYRIHRLSSPDDSESPNTEDPTG